VRVRNERDSAYVARIVIGVGNDLRGDDAAGWETVRRLVPSPSLVLHEHGGDAPGLVGLWGPDDDVVVVDAILSGDPSGSIVEIDALAAPLPADMSWATTHGAGVAEGIELARVLGLLPRSLKLVGISAREFELGEAMTPDVEKAVAEVVRRLAG
jgi:hydrogenase maturation protease